MRRNTRRGGDIKGDTQMAVALLIAVGLVMAAIRALDLMGGDTLRLLALILAVPAGVAVMAIGFTPLVRAWRVPAAPPPERHIIRESRVHTIDHGRGAEPLPAQVPLDLYPAFQGLRHGPEWRAGLLADGGEPGDAGYWRVRPAEQDAAASDRDRWE